MKAIVVSEFGGPEVLVLKEKPDPTPEEGQVLVRIKAAGINPVDTYQRAGGQGYNRPRPFTPGIDGAGTVEAIGDGVTKVAVGDDVYLAGSATGTYAELCLASADQVFPLPGSMSYEDGACLWVNYGTAYRALFQRGGARPGDRVLIHGGTGGVGVAALQWSLWRGLDVITTYGSDGGRNMLEGLGATKVVDHKDTRHVAQVLEMTGGTGVDVVAEMLANVNLDIDMDMVASKGRIVVIGSRGSIEVTPRKLMGKEAEVRGLMLYGASPAEVAEIHAAIAAAGAAEALKPVVQARMTLAEAPDAHEAVMENPSHGKIILTP